MTSQDEHVAQRVEIMSAVVAAIERRADVVEAISNSATQQDALVAVQTLLGVSHYGALAILELTLRRFTEDTRARVAADLAELQAQLPRS